MRNPPEPIRTSAETAATAAAIQPTQPSLPDRSFDCPAVGVHSSASESSRAAAEPSGSAADASDTTGSSTGSGAVDTPLTASDEAVSTVVPPEADPFAATTDSVAGSTAGGAGCSTLS